MLSDKELLHYIIWQRITPLYYLTKNCSTILYDKELLHYIIWQRIIPLYFLRKNYSTILSDKELFHAVIWQRIILLYYLVNNYFTILSGKELFHCIIWQRIMMIMMMNCFCGMVDRRKGFSLISSRNHCQRSSPSRICDTPRGGFGTAQNLSSGLVEWTRAVVITITPRRHELFHFIVWQRLWLILDWRIEHN